MTFRKDNSVEIQLSTGNLSTKEAFRKFLLNEWIKEAVGTKYRYVVETLADGKRIYLERPGRLNKGCDFVIYIEDLYLWGNGNDRPPSHNYLVEDLQEKKRQLNHDTWQHLLESIRSVHTMKDYDVPVAAESEINNFGIMTLEQIKLLCKWFFIEQDVTYWSGQGRDMLMNGINGLGE